MQWAPIDATGEDEEQLDMELEIDDEEVGEYAEFIKSVSDFHTKYNSLKLDIVFAENELIDIDYTYEKLTRIIKDLKNENSESKLNEIIEQYKVDFKFDEKKENLEKLRETHALMTKVQAKLTWRPPTSFRCFVCLENVVDTFLDPCGHAVCMKCWEKNDRGGHNSRCPGCRATVYNARRIYFLS
jgi:predicted Zn-ribbon and HTH transcriptional regulator